MNYTIKERPKLISWSETFAMDVEYNGKNYTVIYGENNKWNELSILNENGREITDYDAESIRELADYFESMDMLGYMKYELKEWSKNEDYPMVVDMEADKDEN